MSELYFVNLVCPNELPKQGTEFSAGYDLIATSVKFVGKNPKHDDKIFNSIDYIEYQTDLSLQIQNSKEQHAFIFPRSSISKYNLVLANSVGVVDNDYIGKISFRFKYITQPEDLLFDPENERFYTVINEDKIYKVGDKIGQLVFLKTNQVHLIKTNNLEETKRGIGAYGSTDN